MDNRAVSLSVNQKITKKLKEHASPCINYVQTSDAQYQLETSSVQAKICSTSKAHLQYYAVLMRHSKDVQRKLIDHQVLVQEGTNQKHFPMNESLLLLCKILSKNSWYPTEGCKNQLIMKY